MQVESSRNYNEDFIEGNVISESFQNENYSGANGRDEENLISLFNGGDHTAFATIYNKLYPKVFYFALRFVRDEEALDLTADAFYKLWRLERHFTRMQSIKVFLQVTVRNACFDHLKAEKSRKLKHEEWLYRFSETEPGDDDPDEIVAKTLQRIYAEIEKLPPAARKIFKLAYFEGLKNDLIARTLKISVNTVHTQKVKALKRLRTAILNLEFLLICLFLSQR